MKFREKIQADLKAALLEKREVELSVLRMLFTSITNKEKEKRYKISKLKPELHDLELEKESYLQDDEVLDTISTEIKKRRDAIVLYEKGQRQELADKEKKEIQILEKYLPEQLSEAKIKELVQAAILKVGAKDVKDTGKIMAEVMPQVKGRAEGSLISKAVRELLS